MDDSRPRKGECYEVHTSFHTGLLTQWRAPYTGGGSATLPSGLRFMILIDPPPQALAVAAEPVPAELWEERLVSEADRREPKYSGYHLVIRFSDLQAYCKRC